MQKAQRLLDLKASAEQGNSLEDAEDETLMALAAARAAEANKQIRCGACQMCTGQVVSLTGFTCCLCRLLCWRVLAF